jgi:hypothetical protein
MESDKKKASELGAVAYTKPDTFAELVTLLEMIRKQFLCSQS